MVRPGRAGVIGACLQERIQRHPDPTPTCARNPVNVWMGRRFLLVSLAWLPFRVHELRILLTPSAGLLKFGVPPGATLLTPSMLRLDAGGVIVLASVFLVADGLGWIRLVTDRAPTSQAHVIREIATVNSLAVRRDHATGHFWPGRSATRMLHCLPGKDEPTCFAGVCSSRLLCWPPLK